MLNAKIVRRLALLVCWLLDRRLDRVLPTIALALVGGLLAAAGAGAEVFKKEDLLRGITITRAQCDATAQTLWLNVHERDFCVRYYLSSAGGEGSRPVVFLQGDQLGKFNIKTWVWTDTTEAKDIDTEDIKRLADGLSELTRTTAIYLARIGVDGTSGNHMARKSALEFDLMNAALDDLKQRYAFEGFHLAGQSGGSLLVSGLGELRHDVGCLVIGSGRIIPPELPKSKDPAKSPFDPILNISQLAQNRSVRMFVVTDKTDKRVPVAQQIGLVDRLRRAGRQVPQFFVETTDELHHNVVLYAELVVAGCVLGRPDEEIARAIATLVKRNAEINEQKRNEAGAKASILAAARLPVPDPAVATAGKK
jgi:hypothetical protein